MMKFLVGEKPKPADIFAALLVGAAMALLVAGQIQVWDWRGFVLLILAADIGAGLVSNTTEATRTAWRKYGSRNMRTWFLIVHLTFYPILLALLVKADLLLLSVLGLVLLAKICAFWSGQRLR